ncbi:MAG: YolD-like family protein [Abditibacteriota bacterium]|nr:YolD-like family protein [Abditibacteriota bacterium]
MERINNRRAQQFVPFAALTGYYKLVEEKENEYEPKREMSEDVANDLNYKFAQLKVGAKVVVRYYKINRYFIIKGPVKYIDMTKKYLVVNGEKVLFCDIYDISGDSLLTK